MRCIALLSGGKDSVAAVEVARGHGWDVVAGLRMVPVRDDSYMFHTPNLDVVAGIAQCMDMPLVTAAASDDPVQEVAELEQALAQAMEDFQIDAILSGALASDYQRTRIDAIGHRLGFKSFAPLWHKDPDTYVDGLIAGGYDIRFSRVASDGLDASWAGASLDADAAARIRGISSRPHIAGEGGEYETVVLDAPHYTSRIVVDSSDVEATASRATWHIRDWHLESKD